ncbi:helix-turn-helix domain-containing protein [Roseburia rectibacter]|nr:helix-turn-helix domain-containing protein [Roseburia rectibacter]
MPIASYMKDYRMKLASKMLLHEDKSISEIVAAVGYKSQSKFISAFRDTFQILPTAYQKLYRNQ